MWAANRAGVGTQRLCSWLKMAEKRRPIPGTAADVAVVAVDAGSNMHPGFATNFAGDGRGVTEVAFEQVAAAGTAAAPSAAVPNVAAAQLVADAPSVAVDGPYGFERKLVVANVDAADAAGAMGWHKVGHSAVAAVAENTYGERSDMTVHRRLDAV